MNPLDSKTFTTSEEPDLFIGHYVGFVDVDDVRRVADAQRAFCEDKSTIFLIADLHRMEHITPEARRAAGEPVDKTTHVIALAIVGASFHFRVIGGMVLRASQLLQRTNAFPVRFYDSQAQARAWFDEMRRELALTQ